jgi:hypothetical protein
MPPAVKGHQLTTADIPGRKLASHVSTPRTAKPENL